MASRPPSTVVPHQEWPPAADAVEGSASSRIDKRRMRGGPPRRQCNIRLRHAFRLRLRSYLRAAAGGAVGPPASATLPLHARAELHERPERARLLRGRVPPLLSAQSVRRYLGPHELGTRGEHRSRPLAASTGGAPRGGRSHGLLGERGRG